MEKYAAGRAVVEQKSTAQHVVLAAKKQGAIAFVVRRERMIGQGRQRQGRRGHERWRSGAVIRDTQLRRAVRGKDHRVSADFFPQPLQDLTD
jgi:hypothetical protein